MALSSVAITGNLSDMLGVDFDTRRTKVWVTTNVESDTVIDTVGNAIRLGSGNVTLNSDGTFTATVWVPDTGSNPDSWQTYIHVDYPDPATRERKTRTFGPFTITAAADLADLVEEQEVPAEYLTTVTTLLDGYVTEAEAARDAAVDISNIDTSDGVVSALVAGTAGAGPLTRAALSASIDARVPQASTTAQGKVELATSAETLTGTDTTRAVTPAAGRATFVQFVRSDNGAALTGHVKITVDPTTHEITDILWEA